MKKHKPLSLALVVSMTAALLTFSVPAAAAATEIAVSAGYSHTLVLMSDGTLWAAGGNSSGQIGNGTHENTQYPVQINLSDVVGISAGDTHSLAVTRDGTLYAWGSNRAGELGINSTAEASNVPVRVMGNVKQAAAGSRFSVALTQDGEVYTWGLNSRDVSQLGHGRSDDYVARSPVKLASLSGVNQISAGYAFAMALESDGTLWGWGSNTKGQIGLRQFDTDKRPSPVQITSDVLMVSCGEQAAYFIGTDRKLYASGSGFMGMERAADRDVMIHIADDVAFVDAGRNHTFIIKTDASLWVWGENSDGQLGLGDYNDRITPVKSRDNVTLVSAGSRHSIVVAGDSSLWASGFNAFGRLCDSTVNNTNRLVRSMAGSRAEARRPFAVKRPGTGLSAWAAPKVNTLSGAGLVPALINKDFQQDITRKELAYLLVPVFERLTGRKLDPMPTDSPFRMSADYLEDTTLAAYLEINMESELTTEARHVMTKAHYGGFMDIIGRRKFQPETVVFQEELYGILMTLADRAGLTVSANTSGVRLQDESSVDPALLNLVKTAYALGIKSGQPGADLNVEPKKPASRELALYLTQLLVEKAPGLKAAGALQRPVMRYGYVGTYGGTWTHEAQHSSPVLADFGGGKLDIISSSYIIVSIDAKTGKENWRAPVGYDRGTDWRTVAQDTRTWSDPVIADIDGDGQKEIVIAHDNGKISVLTQDGYFKPGWERKVVAQGRHLRSMVVADLDKNGKLSIIVGVAELNPINVWVFDCYGNVRTGWPQRPDKAGDDSWDRYTLGIYNNNISVADINGDGFPEIFVPSDTKMMAVYDRAGNDILTGSLFGNAPWARLGFWVDYEYDKNTDPFKNMTHRKDPETTPDSERDLMQPAFSQAVIADLDGNGTPEIVIAGHVIDSIRGWPPSKGIGLFVLNADRSRYNTQHGNWERIPITGAPLSSLAEGDAALQRARYNPVVADLDGDGRMEILFASSDGKLHCYSLDKTQKNSWPYTVGTRSELEWASVPVCTDLDGDGRKEVIFTTWTDREGGKTGRLVVLNYKGEVVMETKLPYPVSQFTNGGMSTPVIADIDGRGQYSIIVGTSLSGIVVYDLPGSTTKAPTTPPTTPPAPPSAPSATPYPNVGVTLDGVKVPVQVYGINGNIYLRLSDLAIAVGINASWNGAVQLDTTKPAGSSTPGEMPTGPVEATPYPNVKVYLDGTEIPVNVYGIDGSTVLALGEVARALNLNPSWENGTAVLTR